MNSRVSMILAGLLLVGAIVFGFWGVSLNRDARVVEAPAVAEVAATQEQSEPAAVLSALVQREERVPVVVLARDVPAMSAISSEDVRIEQLLIAPPGSFAEVEPLLGRVVWRDLPAGTLLNDGSFETGGPVARMIRPNERALAIQIDEVISAGGHIQPGDFVDVLLSLPESERNGDRTTQVVVPALRVLTVGSALGADRDGEPLARPVAEDEGRSSRRPDPARTAVLAVHEQLLTRFLLASEVGTLRLAVRSIDEKLLADYYADKPVQDKVEDINRQLFQFEKLALRQAQRPQPGLAPQRPAGIPVYHGSQVSRQSP